MNYLLHTLVMVMIYVVLAQSMNLQLGYAGLYNLGHVAFFGIGAYTSALIAMAGWPEELGMAVAMLVAGGCGALVAFPVLRLTGDFFGIATLAFAEMAYIFFLNERWLTNGPMGLPGIPRPQWIGQELTALPLYLLMALLLTVAAHLGLRRLVKSPFGRALKVVREDEQVARALGKNVLALKIKAVAVGTGLAGLAGALWAHYVTYISPADFTLQTTILILLCVVLGGKGSLHGPILGAIIVIFFQEGLRFLPIPADLNRFVAPIQGMVFGLALIVLMRKRPSGIWPEHRRKKN